MYKFDDKEKLLETKLVTTYRLLPNWIVLQYTFFCAVHGLMFEYLCLLRSYQEETVSSSALLIAQQGDW